MSLLELAVTDLAILTRTISRAEYERRARPVAKKR